MSKIRDWLRSHLFVAPPTAGLAAFDRATAASTDLRARMRAASNSNDPIRGMLADLWLERHNIPYVTTIYEAHREMLGAIRQKPEDPEEGNP